MAGPAAKRSKRSRPAEPAATEASAPSRPATTSSASTNMTISHGPAAASHSAASRPLSAVAARRAAREAAQAKAVPPTAVSLDKPDMAVAEPQQNRAHSPSGSSQAGSDDAGSDKEMLVESESEPEDRKAEQRGDRKKARNTRYFAAVEEAAPAATPKRARATQEAVASGYNSYAPSPAENDYGSPDAATPRIGRRRREKPSFVDPECVSTFVPLRDENTFSTDFVAADGSNTPAVLLLLQADETLVLRGVCTLLPVFGSLSVLNATLRADVEETNVCDLRQHTNGLAPRPFFAPNSHPVPPIRALSSARGVVSPPRIVTSDGQTVEARPYHAAAVLVCDFETGVEGLERVLAAGGIGHGLGFSARKGKMPADATVGGSSWQVLTTSEPSFTRMRDDPSWRAALQAHLPPSPFVHPDISEWRGEPFVALVEGPKRAGKSTFAKMLAHELLDRFEAVAYLDTDLGQPEFSPPGFVSLTVLRRPALGPAFTHSQTPLVSHFLGSTSPAANPTAYLEACEALVSTYRLEVEYSLGDEPVATSRRYRRPAAARTEAAPIRSRDRVPLVVNTSGWIKGLGADILLRLKDMATPTHVFSLADSATAPDAPVPSPYPVIPLPPAGESPLDSKWSPADLRTLSLVSYFYRSAGPDTQDWATARPLVAQPVVSWSWAGDRGARVESVHILDSAEIRYEHVLHALNGTLVAVIEDGEQTESLPGHRRFPYDPLAQPPRPVSSRALGLAIVHSVSPASETLHLLSPIPTASSGSALTLVKGGGLDIPTALLSDHTASVEDNEEGLAGVEWTEVPYLTTDGDGAGRRRVRRNLMRRGQQG